MGFFDWFGKKELQQQDDDKERIQRELNSLKGDDKYFDKELITNLLSTDLKIRGDALIRAHQMTQTGERKGPLALYRALSIKSNKPKVHFYDPNDAPFLDPDLVRIAEREIYILAKENKLLEDLKKTHSCIEALFCIGKIEQATEKIRKIGDNQLHDFQLLTYDYACTSEWEELRKKNEK